MSGHISMHLGVAGPLLLNQLVRRLGSAPVTPDGRPAGEAGQPFWERLGLTALQWELVLAALLGLSALLKVGLHARLALAPLLHVDCRAALKCARPALHGQAPGLAAGVYLPGPS